MTFHWSTAFSSFKLLEMLLLWSELLLVLLSQLLLLHETFDRSTVSLSSLKTFSDDVVFTFLILGENFQSSFHQNSIYRISLFSRQFLIRRKKDGFFLYQIKVYNCHSRPLFGHFWLCPYLGCYDFSYKDTSYKDSSYNCECPCFCDG